MYQNCCNKCGSTDLFMKPKGSNTGLYCSDCGAWIKWMNKDDIRAFEHSIEVKKPVELKNELNFRTIGNTLSSLRSTLSDFINPQCLELQIPSAVEINTSIIQTTIDKMTEEYIVKACIDSNIDKDTLIRQQEEINQLRTELNKFKAVEGYSIHGRQVYIREDWL